MENERTLQDLKQKQALPLSVKVMLTKSRIRQWINAYGEDGVYVSFSGGKDSTVLLHIVREEYPNVKAVFVDTGLEYPEIRDFVRTFDNVDILRPKLTFKQVVEKYGYPFISKEVSRTVYYARKYLDAFIEKKERLTYTHAIADLFDIDRRSNPDSETYAKVKNGTFLTYEEAYKIAKSQGIKKGCYAKMLFGELEHKKKGELTGEYSNQFNRSKYKFLLGAPFLISSECCSVMKKAPLHKYQKETGRNPITGQMADESRLRTAQWLRQGCNAFDAKNPISNPMSFWTEQDVLRYIKENNIDICNVYGDVVLDYTGSDELPGQLDLSDFGFMEDKRKLKTTGCSRTGCMFCGYGCHLEKPGEGRFERMKVTHPAIYDYIMRPTEKGGLGYKDIIDWINDNSDLNIRY